MLIELLAQSGAEYTAFLHTLVPWAPAAFAVGWAGESESQNWFHIARDYTEKWHHQQQIREAVGDTAELLTPQLFRPFLETVLRGLLHALQAVAAPAGMVLQVRIETSAGGVGQLEQVAEAWQLRSQVTGAALAAEVTLSPEVAWKLFTHALTPAQARSLALITGNEQLWAAVLQLVAVMA